MTTPDEARGQARAIVDADPESRARVDAFVNRWNARHPHRPPVSTRQAWEDFNLLEAAMEAAEVRKNR